jgi:hypothetical protein
VTFKFASSVDTIGPLQFELLLSLVVVTAVARVAALLMWSVRVWMRDHGWPHLLGGSLVLMVGAMLLALPAILLHWLYGITHPNGYACTFVVWPMLFIPAVVYALGFRTFGRRDRRLEGRTQLS